jgi:hypothetical protein
MRTTTQHRIHRPLRSLGTAALCALSFLIACSDDPLATSADGSTASAGGAAVRPTTPLALSAARMLAVPAGRCDYVQATAINDAGVIVGTTYMCPDQKEGAVRWDADGNVAFLPEVDGLPLHPFHVANNGTILATVYERDIGRTRYFAIQPSGRVTAVPLPDRAGSTFSVAAGPNRTGTMLLAEDVGSGPRRYHLWHGAARTVPIPTSPRGELHLSRLNDRADVVGHIRTGDNEMQATIWSRRHGFRMLTLPEGALYGIGGSIDNAGDVFGSTEWQFPSSCTGFFGTSVGRTTIWDRLGVPRLVGDGPEFLCSSGADFRDVNADGVAVGVLSYRAAFPMNNAVVVTADGRAAIAPCELDGVQATEGCHGVAINRRGTVVGTYIAMPAMLRAVIWTLDGQ